MTIVAIVRIVPMNRTGGVFRRSRRRVSGERDSTPGTYTSGCGVRGSSGEGGVKAELRVKGRQEDGRHVRPRHIGHDGSKS